MKASNETIRVADQAVADWLAELHVDYGNNVFPGKDLRDWPVFRVFASPERAFAEVRQLLIQQQFIVAADSETEGISSTSDDVLYKNIPYPFVRIQRGEITPVTELHSTPNTLITTSRGTNFTRSRWPTPYEIPYTIEFVSKTRFTDNYIAEWMMGQFTPSGMGVNQRLIDALFPEPYGNKKLTLTFSGASDASELEVSGAVDRKIRTTYNVTLRVWDFDLVGEEVSAVMRISTECRTLKDASIAVGDFGTLIEEATGKPIKVYHVRPVPERHSCEHSTALIFGKYEGQPPMYRIDADDAAVETVGIPLLAADAMQGAVRVQWRRVDGVKPAGNLRAQMLWRDSDNSYAPSVQAEAVLSYSDDGAVFNFQSIPGNPAHEVSIRFLRPAAGPALNVAMQEQIVYRLPVVNKVDAGDRDQGPGLGTLTAISVPGLERNTPYIVRGYVQVGTQPVTVNIYSDALAVELIATRTFTASAEFSFVLAATNSQLFLIYLTTPVADPALEVIGITVSHCRALPLLP